MTVTENRTEAPSPSAAEAAVLDTVGRVVHELASAGFVSMIAIGDRLGLYAALAAVGPTSAAGLAASTGCNERLVLEWLCSNAAAGYVEFDPATDTFALTAGATAVLADDTSPAFLASAATVIRSYYTDQDLLADAFRGDGGIDWGEHHECMFGGVERFFAAAYNANLTSQWIPSIPGLVEKLTTGARVADVGCGHGVSTALMAQAYPRSEFHGFDLHAPSIARAREIAAAEGVGDRIAYRPVSALGYDEGPFDVVCFFDALHDMGDPEAAIRHARSQLADDGILFLVEMQAGDDTAASVANPLAKWFFAASTALCTPTALSQTGPLALGNQAGRVRWCELLEANGFAHARVAMETPFNLILEARP